MTCDEKNTTLVIGYGYGHDTVAVAGEGSAATPWSCTSFAVFSRTVNRRR